MIKDISIFFENYNHCVRCGKKTKRGEKNVAICTSCGFHNYINPRPTTGAILKNSEGEILLVKRKVPPQKNFWDTPGGFVDLNESVEESLLRELDEELGITVFDLKYFYSGYDTYLYQGILYPTLPLVFVGHIGDQIPQPKSDVSEVKFFTIKEIPFERLAFQHLKDALKEFTKK